MKKVIAACLLIGIVVFLILKTLPSPFSYQMNRDNSMTITIDNEIISDYETIKRDETGTTFKVWFEEK